jgi:hypothetical protein
VNFILDTDNDGILDTNDNLFGNKTDVNYSGSGDLNVAINGMDANGSFDGTKTIRFYNESALFLEFDHNFSNSDLNMSQFTANVFSNSIIIKTNNQLHSTKTIYITDNGFTALCAKDADINSISQMSAGCTDTNEYNFTSCLGGSATISGVICTDLGSTIKFENLQHSAVRGTASTAVTTENLVSSGGSLSCSQYPNSDVCSSEETCGGNWIHAWDSMRCCSKQCVLVPKQNTAEALIIDGNNSSFFEKEYNFLLEKALPIFEKVGGQEEIKIKRLATDKEIKMVRSIRIYSIMTASGIDSGYYNEVTVLIKNISGKKLNGLEVVESVPKKILKKASMISSKNAYTIVEEDPVIKFSFQELVAGSEIEIKYDFNRTSGEGQILEQDFVSIEQPVVLLKMGEEDSCLGVICNDYDTCTSDGCFEGKCVFEENDSCTAGAEESWLGKWSWLLILVIVILIAGAFFLLKKSKK